MPVKENYIAHRDKDFLESIKLLERFINNPKRDVNSLLALNDLHLPYAFYLMNIFGLINDEELLNLVKKKPELIDYFLIKAFEIGQFKIGFFIAFSLKQNVKDYIQNLFVDNPFYLINSLNDYFSEYLNTENLRNPYDQITSSDKLLKELSNVSEHSNRTKYTQLFCLLESFLDEARLKEKALSIQHLPFLEYLPFYHASKLEQSEYIGFLLNNHSGLFSDFFVALHSLFPSTKGLINVEQGLLNTLFRVYKANAVENIFFSKWFNFTKIQEKLYLKIIEKSKNENLKSPSNSLKFVICISGQWRGGNECVDFWFKLAEKIGAPIFISTWKNPGFPIGHKNSLKERILPDKLANQLPMMSDDEIYSHFPKLKKYINNFSKTIKTNELINKKISDYPNLKIKVLYNSEEKFKNEFIDNFGRNPTPSDYANFNQKKVMELLESSRDKLKIDHTTNIIWTRPDLKITDIEYNFVENNVILSQNIKFANTCGDYVIQFRFVDREFFRSLYEFHGSNPKGDEYRKLNGPSLIGSSARYYGNYVDKLQAETNFLYSLKLPIETVSRIICTPNKKILPEEVWNLYDEAKIHLKKMNIVMTIYFKFKRRLVNFFQRILTR